jgi:hypothetical protein
MTRTYMRIPNGGASTQHRRRRQTARNLRNVFCEIIA